MNNISVCIITKNEASLLSIALKSVKWCDEIVVIDDYSIDDTKKVAKAFGAKYYKRKLNYDFASQRNFALKKVTKKWVLFIDSDELVSKELKREILRNIKLKKVSGFYLNRKDTFIGRELTRGENGSTKLMRLALKNSGRWRRRVHEYWQVAGETSVLKNHLVHFPHETIKSFISQINFHSSIHASERSREEKSTSVFYILTFPFLKFVLNFVLKQGFRDKTHGFVCATMMSIHSFLALSKQYEKNSKT